MVCILFFFFAISFRTILSTCPVSYPFQQCNGRHEMASPYLNRLDAFIIAPDNTLRHRKFENEVWGVWENFGGSIQGCLSVIVADNAIMVFARGINGVLYQTNYFYGSNTQDAWSSYAGNLFSDPIAQTIAVDKVDIYAKLDGTEDIWVKSWTFTTSWDNWVKLSI